MTIVRLNPPNNQMGNIRKILPRFSLISMPLKDEECYVWERRRKDICIVCGNIALGRYACISSNIHNCCWYHWREFIEELADHYGDGELSYNHMKAIQIISSNKLHNEIYSYDVCINLKKYAESLTNE